MAARLLIALASALALVGGGYWWGHTATDNAWQAQHAKALEHIQAPKLRALLRCVGHYCPAPPRPSHCFTPSMARAMPMDTAEPLTAPATAAFCYTTRKRLSMALWRSSMRWSRASMR